MLILAAMTGKNRFAVYCLALTYARRKNLENMVFQNSFSSKKAGQNRVQLYLKNVIFGLLTNNEKSIL